MTINEQIKLVSEKHLGENTSEYYQFGYKVFGPFLLGFTAWLAEKTKENSIEKILFFARDGYMMQKAYNEFPLSCFILGMGTIISAFFIWKRRFNYFILLVLFYLCIPLRLLITLSGILGSIFPINL